MTTEIKFAILGFMLCGCCVALLNLVIRRREDEESAKRAMDNWKNRVEENLKWHQDKRTMVQRVCALEVEVAELKNQKEPPKG